MGTIYEYRVIVGENGNEQGHIISTRAKTEAGAKRVLRREIAEYDGDGWGYIEYRESGQGSDCWRAL